MCRATVTYFGGLSHDSGGYKFRVTVKINVSAMVGHDGASVIDKELFSGLAASPVSPLDCDLFLNFRTKTKSYLMGS